MRKFRLGIASTLVFLTAHLFTQHYFPFPDSNAVWNVVGDNVFSGYRWNFRYAVYGDTMINSVRYTKVFAMYDSTILNPGSTYFAAIRENDNRQVYCLIPGYPETILYDFNLALGDTIRHEVGGNLCKDDLDFQEQSHYRIVTAVDSILLENNQYRKRWELAGFVNITVTEGIDSINWFGLFNPIISDYTLCGDFYQFACFKHNDTLIYLNNPFCNKCFCQLITSVNYQESEVGSVFKIFPIPSDNIITIRLDTNKSSFYKIIIYNLMGIKMHETRMNSHGLNINVRNYKKGLYITRLINEENRVVASKKFIVE